MNEFTIRLYKERPFRRHGHWKAKPIAGFVIKADNYQELRDRICKLVSYTHGGRYHLIVFENGDTLVADHIL